MGAKQQPAERTLESNLAGQDVSFTYSETWVAYSIVGLRLVMAWVFLQAGLEKWAEGGWGDPLAWSATGFLNNGVADANPLYGVFVWFADYAAVVDPLIVFGQVLIGLALLLGVFFRFAALMGAVQMLFFWVASWNDSIAAGFPVDHGYFVTSELVYVLLLFGLAAWGAGRIAGLDASLEEMGIVQDNPWLRYLLG